MKKFLKKKNFSYKRIVKKLITQRFLFLYVPELISFFFTTFANFLIFFNYLDLYLISRRVPLKFPVLQPFLYLILNFSRLQEFFSFVSMGFKLQRAFSSGFLLKVFSIFAKKTRRNVKKHLPVLIFLKKFFLKRLLNGTQLFFYSFKKKYLPVVSELSSWGAVDSAIWILRKSFGVYKFRRVKAIKKRVRKFLKKK